VAKFVFVYLFEAHATNEWPLGDAIKINRHETIADRIAAAKLLREKYNSECDIYVDDMNNTFNSAYCAWPERFYILSMASVTTPGTVEPTVYPEIAFIAEPSKDDRGFDRSEIASYLDSLSQRKPASTIEAESPASTSS